MTLERQDRHPAPWPLLDLDVAKIRAAGHQAIPFRQFILKIHSRCNLSCSYCYVYEMADQSWRGLPRRMSAAVADKAVQRIAEHAGRHGLASVDVILHGGEPLLAGAEWLDQLVGSLRASVPAQVNVAVQTNGTLLDRPMLTTLKSLGISIGVSLDGDADATGRHRRYANGRSSFDSVADGLDRLGSPEFQQCYSGILCTVDVENDPVATYEALLKFAPPAVDLLLPHANWSSGPPAAGYADWLICVFERWYGAPRQETEIRLFRELIQLILGNPGEVEGIGLLPSTLIVVDTDGAIKQLDSLSSAYPGAADTGRDVSSSGFDDVFDHPTTVARQIGAEALSPECRACPVMEICGGGLYPHRYKAEDGFRNPSVYCADLLRLITHVRGRVIADLSRLNVLQVIRFDFRGQPRSLRRLSGVRMFHGERQLVLPEHLGETLSPVGPVPRGHFVACEVSGRDQRIWVMVAEMEEAVTERVLAQLDRLAQPAARGKVRRVVDLRRQGERMHVPVDLDETLPCLVVEGKRHVRAPSRAEHGRQVHQYGVEENVRGVGFPAEILRLPSQFLGAGEVPHRAPAVDQVGGGSERVHVVCAQVITAPLKQMFTFLERVPVVAGLSQRGREAPASVQPANVLSAAGGLERSDHSPCSVK